MKLTDKQYTLNINALSFIFSEWCNENGLPHMSADELLATVVKSQEYRDFLKSFITVWDYATDLEVQA